MGTFFSKSLQQSPKISGNHNIIWISNGPMFDMSAILNQTIQNTVEKVEKIVIANNATIIINFMLILIIVILPIMFLCLRYRYREFSPKIDFNNSSLNKSDQSSPSKDKPASGNIPSYTAGYIV